MSFLLRIAVRFAAGSLVAGTIFALGMAHPISSSVTPRDRQKAEQIGMLKDLDLSPISGWLITHREGVRSTVILLHGRSANRMQVFPVAERLIRAGHNVVLWDLPHHGNSTGPATYGRDEVKSTLKVVETIRKEPAVDQDKVFLLGFSFGAAISLAAAASDEDGWIAGIVADSPYANFRETSKWYVRAFGWIPAFVAWPTSTVMFGLGEWIIGADIDAWAPRDLARFIHVPTMLIHGEADWRIPPKASREIFERLGGEKELWLVPGAGHTGSFNKDSDEYTRRVQLFINK